MTRPHARADAVWSARAVLDEYRALAATAWDPIARAPARRQLAALKESICEHQRGGVDDPAPIGGGGTRR